MNADLRSQQPEVRKSYYLLEERTMKIGKHLITFSMITLITLSTVWGLMLSGVALYLVQVAVFALINAQQPVVW